MAKTLRIRKVQRQIFPNEQAIVFAPMSVPQNLPDETATPSRFDHERRQRGPGEF